jgi:hypothetical protein
MNPLAEGTKPRFAGLTSVALALPRGYLPEDKKTITYTVAWM